MLTKHVTENCLEKKPPGSSSLENFGGSGVWLGTEDWSAPPYIKISLGQNSAFANRLFSFLSANFKIESKSNDIGLDVLRMSVTMIEALTPCHSI